MVSHFVRTLSPFSWHARAISAPRVERLATAFAELAPPSLSMLDIGSSDGALARATANRLGVQQVCGVDIKLQPNPLIDVIEYNGRELPFGEASFDLITICDVLHHATHPADILREAMRVLKPGGALLIKDHFRWGSWSGGVLLAMDLFGNHKAGISVRNNYLLPTEWIDLIVQTGGAIDRLLWPFEVHPLPWRWVSRSTYQFVMRVHHRGTGARTIA